MITVPQQAGSFRIGRTRAKSPSQRIAGVVTAFAIEAGFVYLLLTALHFVPMPPMPPPFNGRVLPPDDTDVPVPPPRPPVIDVPKVSTPITPDIEIQLVDPMPNNAITETPPVPPTPRTDQQVATIEQPPPITFSPARALLATHTTPDYPPISRRLGEQGTLRLKLTITQQGAVGDAMVVNSSGHPRLDEAAVDWVKSHWRYQPAMRGPTAVPSTTDAVVTFKLQ